MATVKSCTPSHIALDSPAHLASGSLRALSTLAQGSGSTVLNKQALSCALDIIGSSDALACKILVADICVVIGRNSDR